MIALSQHLCHPIMEDKHQILQEKQYMFHFP